MNITELFSTLRNLSRAEKLQVMQFLVQELADEEALSLQPGATYHVWSPLNSHDAAVKLAALLEEDRQASDG
jgi:ATP phosphoribosyltransferase